MDLRYNINKNGKILVWVASQTFPLGLADREKKIMNEDEGGVRRDIDYIRLKTFFNEKYSPEEFQFDLKLEKSFEEFKTELEKLDKDASVYHCFVFVFLTYSNHENHGDYNEEKLHFNHEKLEYGLVPQADIIDEIKNLNATKGKPKIFLIQADDLSLLVKETFTKALPTEQPESIKIPRDSDQLIIKSTIPQRPFINQQSEEKPSLLIQAFLKAMEDKDKTDLLTLTTTINKYVAELVDESGRLRKADLPVPLVTSTLRKLLYL